MLMDQSANVFWVQLSLDKIKPHFRGIFVMRPDQGGRVARCTFARKASPGDEMLTVKSCRIKEIGRRQMGLKK